MSKGSRRNTVVIVDNVDIDNTLAALAAGHPLLALNVRAVIVTGRPAHPNRRAAVRRLNTQRMKGFLRRAGYMTPVFEGLIPPQTLVPHRVHIDESLLRHPEDGEVRPDGTFAQALEHLCGLEGPIDLVVGGPLGEVRRIMNEPRLKGRLGTLTCQLGLFGFGGVTTMAGGGRTFNGAADSDATRAVLAEWPGEVYMVPTDVTKSEPVGFDTPEDLRSFGMMEELVRLYRIFWEVALRPRGERIYPHDAHPVFLMAQLRRTTSGTPYFWEEVQIRSVGEHGEISAVFGPTGSASPKRFVVRGVEALSFRALLRATVCG